MAILDVKALRLRYSIALTILALITFAFLNVSFSTKRWRTEVVCGAHTVTLNTVSPASTSTSTYVDHMAAQDCSRYLVVNLYWGLTNQIMSLLRGMVAARKLNACLLAPDWYLEFMDPGMMWTLVDFTFFLNWQVTVNAARQQGIHIVNVLPSNLTAACSSQLGHGNLGAEFITAGLLDNWLSAYGVACLSSYNTLVGLQQVSPEHEAMPLIHSLDPSLQYKQLAQSAIETIKHRLAVASFISVQGRVEGDWRHACKHGFHGEKKLFQKRCFIEDGMMRDFLQHGQNLLPATVVYIASGASKDHFPKLCATYHCLTKDDVFDDTVVLQHKQVFQHTTSSAFLDMMIAAQGDAFYGNIYSSFARALQTIFQKAGKKVVYYNPSCQDNGDCS
jgi:hypothetical protein